MGSECPGSGHALYALKQLAHLWFTVVSYHNLSTHTYYPLLILQWVGLPQVAWGSCPVLDRGMVFLVHTTHYTNVQRLKYATFAWNAPVRLMYM